MWKPRPELSPFIEHFIFHRDYFPNHTKELILPDGGIDLIIDLSDDAKFLYDNVDFDKRIAFKFGWISGVHSEGITIQAGLGSPMIVIRFKPGGAWSFFGFPLTELLDHVAEIEAIWGPAFARLRERLLEAPDPNSYPTILDSFFLRHGKDRLEENPFVTYAVEVMTQAAEPPTMRRLAEQIGYSQKHMISLFEKLVGISPKRYARIMRFQKIIHALEDGTPASWSAFAGGFGFYDQAHLIREFRAFSGMTPTRYLAGKGDLLNYMPVE
jgi:AraC-like DNA-binding protein